MSSLISDLFFGSKQAILQQEIRRQQNRDQPTSHAIQFVCQINAQDRIRLQMGTWSCEEQGKDKPIVLIFQQLTVRELAEQMNVQVTIKREKKQARGFIPIQTLFQALQQKVQKTVSVSLHGWGRLKFFVRVAGVGNVLDSSLLVSHEKKQNNNKSKSTNIIARKSKKQSEINLENYQSVKSEYSKVKSSGQQFTQFEKICFQFSRVVLEYDSIGPYQLQWKDRKYSLNQSIQFNSVKGITLIFIDNDNPKGQIHLSSTLLLYNSLSAEYPILSFQDHQCLGIITLLDLKHNISLTKDKNIFKQKINFLKSKNKQTIKSDIDQLSIILKDQSNKTQSQTTDKKEGIIIKIANIIIMKYNKELDIERGYEMKDLDLRNVQNLIILIRIDEKVTELSTEKIKTFAENPYLYDLQVKEVICCQCLESFQCQLKEHIFQIEIYCNSQLIAYGKNKFDHSNQIKTITANGDYCLMMHILTKNIRITSLKKAKYINIQKNTINQHTIQVIAEILQNKFILQDEPLKQIVNKYQKITSLQAEQILNSIDINDVSKIQRTYLVLNKYDCHQKLLQMYETLMRQFLYADPSKSWSISLKQFQRILNFYEIDYKEKFVYQKISYLYFLAQMSLKIEEKRSKIIMNKEENNKTIINQLRQSQKEQNIEVECYEKMQKEEAMLEWRISQTVYINKIQCFNFHLLNNNRIPNIVSNLSLKVYYSNANPQIILRKKVNIATPFQIFDKNIAYNKFFYCLESFFFEVKRSIIFLKTAEQKQIGNDVYCIFNHQLLMKFEYQLQKSI